MLLTTTLYLFLLILVISRFTRSCLYENHEENFKLKDKLFIPVCDVLPVVLRQKLTEVSHKHIYHWLQKAIEFYVTCLTFVSDNDSPGMSSPGTLHLQTICNFVFIN